MITDTLAQPKNLQLLQLIFPLFDIYVLVMAAINDSNSILVIDDEYDIVNIIKLFLQNHGFKVSIFTDPYTALEYFVSNSQDYHIVISDIRMPSMNGYEFVKQVKGIKPQVKIAFN